MISFSYYSYVEPTFFVWGHIVLDTHIIFKDRMHKKKKVLKKTIFQFDYILFWGHPFTELIFCDLSKLLSSK